MQKPTPRTTQGDLDARLVFAATHSSGRVCRKLDADPRGLLADIAQAKLDLYGPNAVSPKEQAPRLIQFLSCLVSPFSLILAALAAVSLVTDVLLAAPAEKDPSTCIIIAVMVGISGTLEFAQRSKGATAAAALSKMVTVTTRVLRRPPAAADNPRIPAATETLPFSSVVVGDIVTLASGDLIPADCRVLAAKDLFVNQAALTGESEPVEKCSAPVHRTRSAKGARLPLAIHQCANLLFAGTTVQSGSATAVVVTTGDETYVGRMARLLAEPARKTSFDEGIESVSRVLVRFMLVMCPLVLVVNGLTKGDWLAALLFSVSVAVGITPQMLPVIVTTCLSRGASRMARQDVIVKSPSAIQNLGAIDVLCCDKTGTLTSDKVVLERHLDVSGKDDERVLREAFLNSWFQTGLRNLIDQAVIERTDELGAADLLRGQYRKVDEVPFDFERRRLSVVVEHKGTGETLMVTKGAVEEMLGICSRVQYEGKICPLDNARRAMVLGNVARLNDEGMRVVAVAESVNPRPVGEFGVADEKDMVLIGYLGFLDPPKPSAAAAIERLRAHGVEVKVLTGDNEGVAAAVCRKVGVQVDNMLLGSEVDALPDAELERRAEEAQLFAKLSPLQKARVVEALRSGAHSASHAVGFMGDGINDAAAMRAADVGVSVDTAVDVAKEAADIILLQKDLLVLERGIEEGRTTYGNTIKYVKATASSNFGNVLSVMVASVFLPFLPMTALQLLLLGLAYTLTCVAIPWDRVDGDFLACPRVWDARSITGFMVWLGPVSSIFDVVTFVVAYALVAPAVVAAAGDPALFAPAFQTAWFVESMWTQTLVLHALRTERVPFVQSRPAAPLAVLTVAGVALASALPYAPGVSAALGLVALPAWFFGVLVALMLGYMLLVTLVKGVYVRRYGGLL